jgi:hypothetical protein
MELEGTKQEKKQLRTLLEEKGLVDFSFAILANIIVGPIALALYFPLDGNYRILGNDYFFHALLTFVCFTALPFLYLLIEQPLRRKNNFFFLSTRKGLTPKKIVSSLVQGVLMHAGIFYPWVVLAQKYVPGVIRLRYFFFQPGDWALYLFFVTLNVIMFEYYSKGFIQLQLEQAISKIKFRLPWDARKIGKMSAFVVQFIVWMGGHWLELTWLPQYMGFVNAFFFVLVSGVLTGYTVYKTENIFGVTVGHILLNVFITATYKV